MSARLNRKFYARESIEVARALLGKRLVHRLDDGTRLSGEVVETEAYLGVLDKGAHTFEGRRTARTEAMYGEPGLSYVYFIYGMYHCLNVVTTAKDIPDLNLELLELLLHIVIHHLKLPEWGSPRLPCIPEVLIVHHADDLDAKFEMYARCLTNDVSDGPFTERDPMLGRALLKARKV